MTFYAICYDIEDDRIRGRIADVLGEYGNRVQKSVFEVHLREADGLERLATRLLAVGAQGADLRFYHLCERCRATSFDLAGEAVAVFAGTIIL